MASDSFKKFFNKPQEKVQPQEEKPKELSFVIPPERREQLKRKLVEYKSRIDPYKEPQLQFDTIYKIAVLEEFLVCSTVDPVVLSKKLKEQYGSFDAILFTNACAVVNDYVSTGGSRVNMGKAGTGLK